MVIHVAPYFRLPLDRAAARPSPMYMPPEIQGSVVAKSGRIVADSGRSGLLEWLTRGDTAKGNRGHPGFEAGRQIGGLP